MVHGCASRLPGYAKHCLDMSIEQYVDEIVNGKLFDPVLSLHLKDGWTVVRPIHGYLQHDEEVPDGRMSFNGSIPIVHRHPSSALQSALKPAMHLTTRAPKRPVADEPGLRSACVKIPGLARCGQRVRFARHPLGVRYTTRATLHRRRSQRAYRLHRGPTDSGRDERSDRG